MGQSEGPAVCPDAPEKHDMSKTTAKTDTPEETGVVAKLRAHKKAHSGLMSATLPETGITVTWPKFQSHEMWMRAQRLAKKTPQSAPDIYAVIACKFDGENVTLEEYKELLPTKDVLFLLGELLGDDEDDEGNVLR